MTTNAMTWLLLLLLLLMQLLKLKQIIRIVLVHQHNSKLQPQHLQQQQHWIVYKKPRIIY